MVELSLLAPGVQRTAGRFPEIMDQFSPAQSGKDFKTINPYKTLLEREIFLNIFLKQIQTSSEEVREREVGGTCGDWEGSERRRRSCEGETGEPSPQSWTLTWCTAPDWTRGVEISCTAQSDLT